jgi:iron complex outermembrane receptor protein
VKPVINGLFGSRVPVINNNVRLEDQEWGTEHAPNFDVNAAGKSQSLALPDYSLVVTQ